MTKKKVSSDIIKVAVTPPSTSFPWIQFTPHPCGIKEPGKLHDEGISATKSKTRDDLVKEIGEMIIKLSPILQEALPE